MENLFFFLYNFDRLDFDCRTGLTIEKVFAVDKLMGYPQMS